MGARSLFRSLRSLLLSNFSKHKGDSEKLTTTTPDVSDPNLGSVKHPWRRLDKPRSQNFMVSTEWEMSSMEAGDEGATLSGTPAAMV